MLTILGTLVGGITSILPKIFDFLGRKEELKHARELAQIEKDLVKFKSEQEMAVIESEADIREGESLRRHDSSLDGTGFISALRRSVRPVITYFFFFLFVFIKVMTVYIFVQNGNAGDWLADSIAWNDIYPLIWDENTQALFAAVIGFWFGSRAIEKLKF